MLAKCLPIGAGSSFLTAMGNSYLGSKCDNDIGGFPLIWERINGQGTCLWASEIEEFPIAVTKKRFSEIKGVTNDGK